MSFHLTAQDIRVENNHTLVGKLQNQAGDYVESSIDLNRFLGNNNGTSPSSPALTRHGPLSKS